MSGRKIDNHGSWIGSKGNNSVCPDGPYKNKEEHSADSSCAHVGTSYPDTTEQIHSEQKQSDAKAKSQPMKTGYRY
jgi:hypothetical protein